MLIQIATRTAYRVQDKLFANLPRRRVVLRQGEEIHCDSRLQPTFEGETRPGNRQYPRRRPAPPPGSTP